MAKKPFKNRDGDRFESLVSQYKKKLMAYTDKSSSMKRNKWFDSLWCVCVYFCVSERVFWQLKFCIVVSELFVHLEFSP